MEYYIQHRLGETAVAVLNPQREMVAYTIERHHNPSLVGGIYVARVHEVNPSQSIGIVDLGGQKAILNDTTSLTEGCLILVQVLRDGFQHKLPAVHRRISIENVYFVKNSTGKNITFDRTIGQGKARAELKNCICQIIGDDTGVFIKKQCLYADIKTLQLAYADIKTALQGILRMNTHKIQQIRPAPNLIQRTVQNAQAGSVVVVDDLETLHLIKQAQNPKIDICHYKQGDAFEQAGIYDMVESLLQRKVPLEKGGSVVFENTEALTAIDVNMGNVANMNKGDDALFRFNKTACRIIAQHIVLRHISGLIVIDFVRMKNRGMMKQVPKVLQSCMRTFDPAGIWDVMDITKSGLVEMTRKRTRPSIADTMLVPPTDRHKNPETVALELVQQLLRTVSVGTPTIFAPYVVIDTLQKSSLIKKCENRIKKTIVLQNHPTAYTDWIK